MTELEQAVSVCRENWKPDSTDARRLFHGRGHCYSGLEFLSVDWFPPFVMLTVFGDGYSDAWLTDLSAALHKALPAIKGLLVQQRKGRATESRVLLGEVPVKHTITEAGLSYQVEFRRNQNVGFFLDMAPARRWLQARAQDKSVLNLFAFTCAFSVAALAGGARRVVNNDMSRAVLDRGRDNHVLNEQELTRVNFIPHNLFRSWGRVRQLGRYDLIVIDPPTNQRGSFVAEKDYGGVLKRIPQLANPGAQILTCLNSPFLPFSFLEQQMARHCSECRLQEILSVADGFSEAYPDRGLKVGVFGYK